MINRLELALGNVFDSEVLNRAEPADFCPTSHARIFELQSHARERLSPFLAQALTLNRQLLFAMAHLSFFSDIGKFFHEDDEDMQWLQFRVADCRETLQRALLRKVGFTLDLLESILKALTDFDRFSHLVPVEIGKHEPLVAHRIELLEQLSERRIMARLVALKPSMREKLTSKSKEVRETVSGFFVFLGSLEAAFNLEYWSEFNLTADAVEARVREFENCADIVPPAMAGPSAGTR